MTKLHQLADLGIDLGRVADELLERAQALGDRRAMEEAGRRVVSFDLGEDVTDGLERLAEEE